MEHLRRVQAKPEFAGRGVLPLVLAVLAYAADEAEGAGWGHANVTLHADGSVTVPDDGRGTDTRRDADGRPIKPIMATPDLRFFDHPTAQTLADGDPRRGISVVAALSEWLVHENRRAEGAWYQRYEAGVPVMELLPVAADGSTGTSVRFLPVPGLLRLSLDAVRLISATRTPDLRVTVSDQRL